MRCTACNKSLNDREARSRDKTTREYLDLCARCSSASKDVLREWKKQVVQKLIPM